MGTQELVKQITYYGPVIKIVWNFIFVQVTNMLDEISVKKKSPNAQTTVNYDYSESSAKVQCGIYS